MVDSCSSTLHHFMGDTIRLPQLAIQPQQPTDPLDQYGKLLSVQRLAASQDLQKAQIQNAQLDTQSKQLEVAQQQRDAQDQQTMRTQAPNFVQKDQSGKVTGFDSDGYFNSLLANSVSPTKVAAIRQQQAQMSKALSESGEAALKLQDAKTDNAYQILEGVRQAAKLPGAGPNTMQGAYQDALPRLQQLGIDTSQYPKQFAQVGDQGLQQFEAMIGAHKQIINDAKNQSETDKNTAQENEAQAGANQRTTESAWYQAHGMAPGVSAETQGMSDWLQKNPGKGPSDYITAMKKIVPAYNFNLQANGTGGGQPPTHSDGTPLTQDELYASFGTKAGVVKGIVENRQKPPSGAAQTSPYWRDVMQKVYQVDPQWDGSKSPTERAKRPTLPMLSR